MNPLVFWSDLDDQDRGAWRRIEAWDTLIAKDPQLSTVEIVLDLILGDRTRLFACSGSEPIATALASGATRHLLPVLMRSPDVDNTYDLGSSPGARSISLSVPSLWLDPMDHIRRGLPLSGFAEVSLLAPGMAWRDRRVILRGDVGGMAFGAPQGQPETTWSSPRRKEGQIVELTVADPRGSVDAAFPPWVVQNSGRDVTWGTAPDRSNGKPYPIVFGGHKVDAIQVTSGADPDWLVAYGHGWTLVTVWRNDTVSGSFTLVEDADDNGVAVTLVRPTPAAFVWEDSDRVFVEIRRDENPLLFDVYREVIEVFTSGGTTLVNELLLAEASARIGARRVAAQVNKQTTALRWLEEGLLSELPMVAGVWDQGRYGPVATDWRSSPRAQLRLGGRLYRRVSLIAESDKADLYNEFLVRYGYDLRLDVFDGTAEASALTSDQCAVSELAVGRRAHPTIDLVVADQAQTAEWLVDWMIQHLSLGSLYGEWSGEPALFFDLRRGDVVSITDVDLGWTDARATVERISRPGRGEVTVGLRIWQNPYRTGAWA